jgi:hypothetical protein
MVDIPRIKFFAQRRYRANWPVVDGHKLTAFSLLTYSLKPLTPILMLTPVKGAVIVKNMTSGR